MSPTPDSPNTPPLRDHHDALLDQLLREILGGDRPRDLTARVMAQAKIYDRFRRRWWVSAVTATAASVALATSLFMFWPQKYPGYEVHGVTLVNSNEAQPGTLLTTDEITTGKIAIGGYVGIDVQPQTTLTLGGEKFKEKVFLEEGELLVNVKKNKGQFDVAVGPATVHVTGTSFNVNVVNDESATEQKKILMVTVDEGSVEIKGIPGQDGVVKMRAKESKEFVILNTPKVIPPVNTALRAGLLAAAQEGVRLGNRGTAVGKQPQEGQPARAVVNQAQQARGTLFMQLILNPGTTDRIFGKVQRERDLYYLQTYNRQNKPVAKIYLFPVTGVPNPAWTVQDGQSIGVVWTDSRITALFK